MESQRDGERENVRGAERSTNLKERISSGRVIESEVSRPILGSPFSALYSHLFSVISRPSIPLLPSHFLSPSQPFLRQSFYSPLAPLLLLQGNYLLLSISLSPVESGNGKTQRGLRELRKSGRSF